MKRLLSTLTLTVLLCGNAIADTGYNSPDAKYVKACVDDAKTKIKAIGEMYSIVGDYDTTPDLTYANPTFLPAFKNPVRPEQYIHPIEFSLSLTKGFQTTAKVFYSSAKVGDPNACVFQGISFLDQTDAN